MVIGVAGQGVERPVVDVTGLVQVIVHGRQRQAGPRRVIDEGEQGRGADRVPGQSGRGVRAGRGYATHSTHRNKPLRHTRSYPNIRSRRVAVVSRKYCTAPRSISRRRCSSFRIEPYNLHKSFQARELGSILHPFPKVDMRECGALRHASREPMMGSEVTPPANCYVDAWIPR